MISTGYIMQNSPWAHDDAWSYAPVLLDKSRFISLSFTIIHYHSLSFTTYCIYHSLLNHHYFFIITVYYCIFFTIKSPFLLLKVTCSYSFHPSYGFVPASPPFTKAGRGLLGLHLMVGAVSAVDFQQQVPAGGTRRVRRRVLQGRPRKPGESEAFECGIPRK